MIIKDFNSFKNENPNEIVFTIKDLEDKGVKISLSEVKGYYDIDQSTELCYDPTKKIVKKFSYNDEEYKIYNLESKGEWYNRWFGLLITKSGEPVYAIFLYERKGVDFDENRGILTLNGLEDSVTIFLDNGEVKRTKN